MSLPPTMKRRLHERLHPLIGEEEADALLDQISPPDPLTREWLRDHLDERFAPLATKEWIEDRFVTKAHLDERLEPFVTKVWLRDHLDERLEPFVTKVWLRDHLDERLEPFVTKVWLRDHLDERLEPFVTKEHLDARLEIQDHKMEAMEHRIVGAVNQALQRQIHWVYGAAGSFALIISVVDRIWG